MVTKELHINSSSGVSSGTSPVYVTVIWSELYNSETAAVIIFFAFSAAAGLENAKFESKKVESSY